MTKEKILAFIDWCEEIPPPYIFIGVSPQLINHDHLHYQRPRIEEKVEKYVHKIKEWEDQAYLKIAPAVLFKRIDGTLWSLDSQHHAEAAMRCGMDLIPALILESKNIEWEAKIFDKLQKWQEENGK